MGGILLIFCALALIANGVKHALVESEEPSASVWLDERWMEENEAPVQMVRDKLDGCICRVIGKAYAVCYGGDTCAVFPRQLVIPVGIVEFRLKTTGIVKLSREDVANFSSLESLWVDANNNLREVVPGSFTEMGRLRNLSISYNSQLKFLHPDTFVGLVNLECLRLVKNGFGKVLDVSLALRANYLPRLLYLSLCENSFPVIEENSFAPLNGTSIQALEIVLCQITKIHPNSLLFFKDLKKLRMGDNLFSEEEVSNLLESFANNNISLKLFNLYNSGFRRGENLTKLLSRVAQLGVVHLVLARNHIENISVGLFPFMPDLEILDLREVSAVSVEPTALNPEILPRLKILLLAGNKLSGIIPGVKLPQLSFLDLSENSYSPTSYFDVSAGSPNSTSNITSLDLSYNRVSTIRNETFLNFQRLEVLGLKNATLFYVSGSSFQNLTFLRVLNLENNPLQPFNRFETPIFDGLINLEVLYLGNCKITSFNNKKIFSNLVSLRYLSLKDNDLIHIDPQLLSPLPSLMGIDLSENQIQPWTKRSFENNTKLRIGIFSANRLYTVTIAMVQDLAGAVRVDFSNNAFTCDCWSFNLTKTWLRNGGIFAVNSSLLSSNNYFCSAPEGWKASPVVAYLASEDSCAPTNIKFNMTPINIFMIVVALLSIFLGILAYIFRWHLRYWIFLARMAFLRHHGWLIKKNKIHPADYKYDVFVSYSHEDRNFILRLVAMLENQHPFLKLCVYERDFEIGTVISTTVMEKVAMSRRTLLVVSNSFAKSQWCMWELQLAESHRLFFRSSLKEGFRNDPLVIIKLGPIAPANLTPTLKFLLKSRIYLDWDQEQRKQVVFWQKLRATLMPDEKTCRERITVSS